MNNTYVWFHIGKAIIQLPLLCPLIFPSSLELPAETETYADMKSGIEMK